MAKTKVLISLAVLAYAKSRFSRAAQLSINFITLRWYAHRLGKNRVTRVILSEVEQEKF